MRAIGWTAYGKPEVLKLIEIEKPTPKSNEVLVRIYAAAVTTGDCRLRGLRVPSGFGLPTRLAFGVTKPRKLVPGMDFSGIVESVGNGVKQFKIGDRVFGTTGANLGANAEYTCVNEEKPIVKIPDSLSYEDAVSIIFGGLTAVHFLRGKVKIRENHRVLINGASGSVGTASVQIAKYYGAEVTAICSAANHELVKSIGADKVIDYAKQDFSENGEDYDIILDTVGNLSFSKCNGSLTKSGKAILIAAGLGTTLQSLWNNKMICGVAGESKEALNFLLELVDSRKFRPTIDTIYPLQDIVQAHNHVDKGHKKGNVILSLND